MNRPALLPVLALVACVVGCDQGSGAAPADKGEAAKSAEKPAGADAQAKAPRRATVLPLEAVEHRQTGGGAAHIWALSRGDNAFFGKLELAPGGKVPEHRDPTEEFIHIIEGGGRFTIDGEAHEVGPGTTIYMPPGARVSFENGPAKLVAIQVFAGPEPAAKYESWDLVSRPSGPESVTPAP